MSSGLVKFEQFDPGADLERLRVCHSIAMPAWEIDHPGIPPLTVEAYQTQWQAFDGSPVHAFIANDLAGRPVGCCCIMLPAKENRHVAYCAPTVALDQRRAGTGTSILAQCSAVARANGRTHLVAFACDGTPGAAFAKARGAVAGHADILRTLTITAEIRTRVAELRGPAEQAATGYELLCWRGVPPDQHLSQLAVVQQSMEDAPRNAGMEPMTWDANRVREVEQNLADAGFDALTVVARHVTSGKIAALTQVLLVPSMPEWAAQQSTVVLPAHRGHRLGLLLKIEMIGELARQAPQVRRVFTGNAGQNEHMIAINELLGYEISSVIRMWELTALSHTHPNARGRSRQPESPTSFSAHADRGLATVH